MIPLAPLFIQIKENLVQLSEVLLRERSALATAKPDDILQLASEKKALLDAIDTANSKRQSMLIKFGVLNPKKPSDKQFFAWLSQQDNMEDVKSLVEECERLLNKCKQDNQTNARILSTLQKRNKTMLEMLQGHNRKNKVYTSNGNTRPVSSKHTIGRA
ncbi:flagella synthesis protein FlgN [Marinomonas ostreistagni]|uniref:Flagellar protein FlgN n=1 Tax=Marinomonas ostreistagni TaxID=359209 RepID=A0ABS0Z616_9GAMM|nr:flagellar protein FlgN [Marinomonas ostreistagni]MBJ7549100.1 flagellar protein FlgN [Marinomonas ostreistagni]